MRARDEEIHGVSAERPTGAPAPPVPIEVLGSASAAGNRSIARAVGSAGGERVLIGPAGRLVVARAPAPSAAPARTVARDDPPAGERQLSENDKRRLRTMAVARLRGAVTLLKDPAKSDLPRISRQLTPVEQALLGFAVGGEAGATLDGAAAQVRMVAIAVGSAAGNVKTAVARGVARWQAAQRQLGAARSAIAGELARLNRAKPGTPDPEGVDREQMIQDMAHLKALQAQMGNAVRDLVEAPRNEEGLAAVLEGNLSLDEEMGSLGELSTASALAPVAAARRAFTDGVATLAPFAMKPDDFLREMRTTLQTAANSIAALVGDEEEAVEGEEQKDTPPPVPPDPAPSPNPLPPPPPPPPGGPKG